MAALVDPNAQFAEVPRWRQGYRTMNVPIVHNSHHFRGPLLQSLQLKRVRPGYAVNGARCSCLWERHVPGIRAQPRRIARTKARQHPWFLVAGEAKSLRQPLDQVPLFVLRSRFRSRGPLLSARPSARAGKHAEMRQSRAPNSSESGFA